MQLFHSRKKEIWSGEFIDLSALQDDDVEDLTFNVRTGAVSTTTGSKKTFVSIEQWTDAFNVFSSGYRIKYPTEAEGLSTYMGLIRQISDRNGNWTMAMQSKKISNDQELIQSDPTSCPQNQKENNYIHKLMAVYERHSR